MVILRCRRKSPPATGTVAGRVRDRAAGPDRTGYLVYMPAGTRLQAGTPVVMVPARIGEPQPVGRSCSRCWRCRARRWLLDHTHWVVAGFLTAVNVTAAVFGVAGAFQ